MAFDVRLPHLPKSRQCLALSIQPVGSDIAEKHVARMSLRRWYRSGCHPLAGAGDFLFHGLDRVARAEFRWPPVAPVFGKPFKAGDLGERNGNIPAQYFVAVRSGVPVNGQSQRRFGLIVG